MQSFEKIELQDLGVVTLSSGSLRDIHEPSLNIIMTTFRMSPKSQILPGLRTGSVSFVYSSFRYIQKFVYSQLCIVLRKGFLYPNSMSNFTSLQHPSSGP